MAHVLQDVLGSSSTGLSRAECLATFAGAFLAFVGVYSLAASTLEFPLGAGKEGTRDTSAAEGRARSWIITTAASAVTTCASLPFVWDLVRSGMDVAQVSPRARLADAVTTVFVAYLGADLAVGAVQYGSHIKLTTGWGHHLAYMALLPLVTSCGLSSVFLLGLFMELPTFILGSAMIAPKLRHDSLFATLFFTTRIVLHARLIHIFGSLHGREHARALALHFSYGATSSSLRVAIAPWIPVVALCLAAPLHITWFWGSFTKLVSKKRSPPALAQSAVLPATAWQDSEQQRGRPAARKLPTAALSRTRSKLRKSLDLRSPSPRPRLAEITNARPAPPSPRRRYAQVTAPSAEAAAALAAAFDLQARGGHHRQRRRSSPLAQNEMAFGGGAIRVF